MYYDYERYHVEVSGVGSPADTGPYIRIWGESERYEYERLRRVMNEIEMELVMMSEGERDVSQTIAGHE